METTAPRTSEVVLLSRKAVSQAIVITTLAALGYGAVLFLGDRVAIGAAASEVGAPIMLAACGLNVGNYLLRFARWQMYLLKLRLDVPLGLSGVIFLAGFAMSITPAKMGELLKSLLLRESRGIPIALSAPVVLAERITDVIGLVLVGAAGLAFVPGGASAAALGLLLAGGLASLFFFRRLGLWVFALLEARLGPRRLLTRLREAYDALGQLSSARTFAGAILLSCVSWGLQGVSLWLLARGPTGGALDLAEAQFAYAAPLLAGTLALIPGGLGLTEATMSASVATLAQSDAAVAAALTILTRAASFWLAVLIGFAALGAYFFALRPLRSTTDS